MGSFLSLLKYPTMIQNVVVVTKHVRQNVVAT